MREKICEYCGDKFQAQRRTARFCSDRCRSKWNYADKNGLWTPRRIYFPETFKRDYKANLDDLRQRSAAQAVDALIEIVKEYGYDAGFKVLADIMAPMFNDHIAKYNALAKAQAEQQAVSQEQSDQPDQS